MRCTDCQGGTPHPWWKRCVQCAMRRLRRMMSPFPIAAPEHITRRWKIEDRVRVQPVDDKQCTALKLTEDEVIDGIVGRVARTPQGDQFVIDLERGGRYYASATELTEAT